MAHFVEEDKEEKIALNSNIEMNSNMNNKQITHCDLNEGAGFDSYHDNITNNENSTPSSNQHKYKIICFILVLLLLLYCIIGITYLLIIIHPISGSNNNNYCQCTKMMTESSSISYVNNNNMTTTSKPSITPTQLPTKNPTLRPTKMASFEYKTYEHYVGDYKISAHNISHDYWLLCDGSFLDPNHYSYLFHLIGYSFGSQISGTVKMFGLPDIRNQIIGINGDKYKMGNVIGKESITLNVENIPSHSHLTTHNGQCKNGNEYSQNQPYLAQNCGFLKDSIYAYNLATTTSTPDSIPTNNVGNGKSFQVYQPTMFIGNLFIYVGVEQ